MIKFNMESLKGIITIVAIIPFVFAICMRDKNKKRKEVKRKLYKNVLEQNKSTKNEIEFRLLSYKYHTIWCLPERLCIVGIFVK